MLLAVTFFMIDLYPNATLPIMWGIFILVVWVLSRLVFAPTLDLIDERKKRTDDLKQEAARLSQTTVDLVSRYEKKMAEARVLAARERERIINSARAREHEILSEARKENEEVLLELRGSIEGKKKEGELRLRHYVRELAAQVASKILDRNVGGSHA